MKFNQCKGNRLHKQFIWITTFSNLWWSYKADMWVKDPVDCVYSSTKRCKSLKAFKRHLRKHPEIRSKALLVSKFKGYDIEG